MVTTLQLLTSESDLDVLQCLGSAYLSQGNLDEAHQVNLYISSSTCTYLLTYLWMVPILIECSWMSWDDLLQNNVVILILYFSLNPADYIFSKAEERNSMGPILLIYFLPPMPMSMLILMCSNIMDLIIFVSSGPQYRGCLNTRMNCKTAGYIKEIIQYKSYYLEHYKTYIFAKRLALFLWLKQNISIHTVYLFFTPPDLGLLTKVRCKYKQFNCLLLFLPTLSFVLLRHTLSELTF